MTGQDILRRVHELQLTKGSFVVFGSALLALSGIRQSHDIDIVVSEEAFNILKHRGWKQVVRSSTSQPLINDVYDVHLNWTFGTYDPTLQELLDRSIEIDNIPFASLIDVLQWKQIMHRPKDLEDISLIYDRIISNRY